MSWAGSSLPSSPGGGSSWSGSSALGVHGYVAPTHTVAAPPPKSTARNVIDRVGSVASTVGRSVAHDFTHLATGVSEAASFNSNSSTAARKAQNDLLTASTNMIVHSGRVIKDPTSTPAQVARAKVLLAHATQTAQDVSKQATARNNQVLQATKPKQGAADVVGIGADILSAGTYGAAAKGAQAGRLAMGARAAEAGGRSVVKTAVKGAVTGAATQGGASAADQELRTGKIDKKQLAISAGVGAAMGGVGGATTAHSANTAADKVFAANAKKEFAQKAEAEAQSKKTAAVDSMVKPQNTDVPRLGAGKAYAENRIKEIDKIFEDHAKGNIVATTHDTVPKTMDTLGEKRVGTTTPATTKAGTPDMRTGAARRQGTVALQDTQPTKALSGQDLRALSREHAQLTSQLEHINNPKAPESVTVDTISKQKPAAEPVTSAKAPAQPGAASAATATPKTTLEDAVNSVQDTTPDRGAKFTKAFLSTTGLLTRHGAEGQKLASMVHDYNHTARDFSTSWFNKVPTLTKLNKNESGNFAAVVQGKAPAINAKVAQAAKEWKGVSPEIRQAFITHSGEDVGNVENYFPRQIKPEFLKPGSKGFNAAVQHLVDTGQAKNSGEAIQAMNFARKSGTKGNVIGSFKFHRNYDLPDHMYDTSKTAIANYLEGAAHSVAGAKVFNMDKGGTLHAANDLIGKVAERGGNAEEVKKTFEQAMGLTQHSEGATKATNTAREINAVTKLGLGAITNAGQTANTIEKNGYLDTLKGLGYLGTKEGRQYARDTGAFTHGLISDLREQTGFRGITGKIGAPFFNNVEQFNRYLAAAAGKFHGDRLASRASGGGLGHIPVIAKRSERDLRALRVEGPIGKNLTREQSLRAGRGSSDATQFTVAPHTLPGWASSPVGKLVSQFQTFSYKQTGFVNNEVLKPLKEGNPVPLIRLMSLLPAGYGIVEAKNKLRGKDDSGDSPETKILNAWRATGGGGTLESLITGAVNAKKYANSGGEFVTNLAHNELGPTVGTAIDTAKSGYSATTGDFKPAKQQGLSMIPVVGPTLKNRLVPSGSVSASHVAKTAKDVSKELNTVNYSLKDTSRSSGRAAKLSDADYQKYLQKSTEAFTGKARAAMQDPQYKSLSTADKKATLQQALTDSRKQVLDAMVGKTQRSTTRKYKKY